MIKQAMSPFDTFRRIFSSALITVAVASCVIQPTATAVAASDATMRITSPANIELSGLQGSAASDKSITNVVATTATATECVVLLHGLGRTNMSMANMAEALEDVGFKTANIDYPSRQKPIEELAYIAVPKGLQACDEEKVSTIHFVTHSMGGIVLRYYLEKEGLANLGRVVMMSPPNQGSPLVDEIAHWGLYKFFNGPAGQQLGTGTDSIPLSLGPVDYPVGIITGNKHSFFDAWAAKLIPGDDDGKVSIDGAKVDGMSDFMVVGHTHSFIMNQKEVISQTVFFLQNGMFDRTKSTMQTVKVNEKGDLG